MRVAGSLPSVTEEVFENKVGETCEENMWAGDTHGEQPREHVRKRGSARRENSRLDRNHLWPTTFFVLGTPLKLLHRPETTSNAHPKGVH